MHKQIAISCVRWRSISDVIIFCRSSRPHSHIQFVVEVSEAARSTCTACITAIKCLYTEFVVVLFFFFVFVFVVFIPDGA